MKDTPTQIADRLASIRDNPPEEIPMPVIVKREHPLNKPAPIVHRCPTCNQRIP